jgi:glycosyltransferase involved in cell wall biosynthesis
VQNTRVSVVIPTFNSARTLPECLKAIRTQRYPQDRIEIVVADAGSTDSTLDIVREFKCDRIVRNELLTGEAGKSAGIKAATGEIIALVDSDNVLDSPDWLGRMLEPFDDPEIMATEPLWYTRRESDPPLTRYFAMLGMSDPLCLFLGNYDRMSLVSGRWTDLSVRTEDRSSYLKLTLDPANLPTIGANGFVIRRSLLDGVKWDPYFFDIDIMSQAIEAGHRHVAKVKCGVVHLYCRALGEFARKQDRRIRDFLFFSRVPAAPCAALRAGPPAAPCAALRAGPSDRTYPWDSQRRIGVVRFAAWTLLILPLLVQMLRGWRRQPDRAWWFHVPACWITLFVYGRAMMLKAFGMKPKQKSRRNWRQ